MRFAAAPVFALAVALGAPAQSPQVAITFDDLPAHSSLPPGVTRLQVANQILAVIQHEHLPPVYGMVNGIRTQQDPSTMAVLKAWRAAGQPLASHGWTHMNLNEHPVEDWEKDVLANEPILQQLMPNDDGGQAWHWLRYPNLGEGDTPAKRIAARQWLDAHHYRVAEVTLEFNDYNFNPPYARCAAKHDDATIARLHDLYLSTAKQHFVAYREEAKAIFGHEIPYVLLLHIGAFDARMFPELIAQMKATGFTFTTLQNAEADPAYNTDPAQMTGGGTMLDQLAHFRHIAIPHRDDPTKELDAMCQ